MRAFQAAPALLLVFGCAGTIGSEMRTAGFVEVRPASRHPQTGTVIVVKRLSPLIAGTICTSAEALGSSYRPRESPTLEKELKSKVEREINLDAGYLKTLQAQLKYKGIKSVSHTLKNTKVYDLSDTEVRDALDQRLAPCQASIDDRLKRKDRVSMLSAALEADVTYKVEFDQAVTLSVSEKEQLVEGLAAELGFGLTRQGSETITGAGLIWGVRDDPYLPTIRAPKDLDVRGLRPTGERAARAALTGEVPVYFEPETGRDD
jgi:hypothetical protein